MIKILDFEMLKYYHERLVSMVKGMIAGGGGGITREELEEATIGISENAATIEALDKRVDGAVSSSLYEKYVLEQLYNEVYEEAKEYIPSGQTYGWRDNVKKIGRGEYEDMCEFVALKHKLNNVDKDELISFASGSQVKSVGQFVKFLYGKINGSSFDPSKDSTFYGGENISGGGVIPEAGEKDDVIIG